MSAVSHVSLGTNDYPKAKAFYDAVLATIGLRCVMDYREGSGYGRDFPEFWIQVPHDRKAAAAGNGTHVCFNAANEEEVKAFHRKALELGGEDEGLPGLRPEYTETYYGAFVRDPDGNKIEAMCWVKKG